MTTEVVIKDCIEDNGISRVLKNKYTILCITNINGENRIGDKYFHQIGKKLKFLFPPRLNIGMFLEYVPDSKDNYEGTLRTSKVINVETCDEEYKKIKVLTQNAIYYF